MTARLQRDDEVMIIAGRDKGRRGKVQRVIPAKGTALVEGLNIVKRHVRPGVDGARQGGIIDKEMPINMAKLMPVCPACGKPTRIAIKVLEDGTKARMCKRCQGMFS